MCASELALAKLAFNTLVLILHSAEPFRLYNIATLLRGDLRDLKPSYRYDTALNATSRAPPLRGGGFGFNPSRVGQPASGSLPLSGGLLFHMQISIF